MNLFLQGFHLLSCLAFLCLFSLEPLCVPPSCFSDKAPFIRALVPTCWLCFPSSSLQSGDTGGSGAAPLCLWSLMWPAAACTRLWERKACGNPLSTAEVRGKILIPLQALSKCPSHPPWGSTVWPLWNGPPWQGTKCKTQKLTAGNEIPPVGDLLWAAVLHIACSQLTLRAAWCHSTSFYLEGMTNDGVWYGEICRQLAYKLAKPGGDGWHMVEYSTFTPPQAIGFNRPCNVKCLIVRKITSHIMHHFMGVPVPKLWLDDIKVHHCSTFSQSLFLKPLRRWYG